MILPAQAIRQAKIITPLVERSTVKGMTYGCGPAGYDVRLAQTITLFPGTYRLASTIEHFTMPNDVLGQVCDKSTLARQGIAVQNTVIEPGWRGFLTLEISYQQLASELAVTQLPWPGAHVSPVLGVPFSRTVTVPSTKHIVLQEGTPIAQILFMRLETATDRPYVGKYQDQEAGPQPARFTEESDGPETA